MNGPVFFRASVESTPAKRARALLSLRPRWLALWGGVWVPALLSVLTIVLALTNPSFVDAKGSRISLVGMQGLEKVSASSSEVVVDDLAVLEEPDVLESWARYAQFRETQTELFSLASGTERLVLDRAEGRDQIIYRAPVSPLRLGWVFWLQVLTALFCASAAEITWKLAHPSIGLLGYRLSGWGVACAAWASSLYTARSVAIQPVLLDWSHAVNSVLGGPLFGAGICMLLVSEPRKLGPSPWLWLLGIPITLILWLGRLGEGPAFAGYLSILFYTAAIPVILTAQWFRARSPVDRAVWRWQSLATLGGIALFVMAQAVPVAFGQRPIANQAVTLVGFAVLFLLMSLGATRYRLFSVARYWGRTWFWVGTTVFLLGLDLALASWLPLGGLSSGVAVLLVAWCYFPVRQWLVERRQMRRSLELAPIVAELSHAESHAELLVRFERRLVAHFSPANVELVAPASAVSLSDDGSALTVPWPEGDRAYRFIFKDGGRSLFDTNDATDAESLLELARTLLAARVAFARGEEHERKRLRRDLHDHLGARLSQLALLAGTSEVTRQIAALSNDLRQLTAALSGEPTPWALVLFELEAEARSLASALGLKLTFDQEGQSERGRVTPSMRGDLLAFVRETLNNAARHGEHKKPILFKIEVEASAIRLTVINEVASSVPSVEERRSMAGFGLSNLERRAQLAGGHFSATRCGNVFTAELELNASADVEPSSGYHVAGRLSTAVDNYVG